MNEITRIHLAKTAYDAEVAAKKQLEKYIKSLEGYTQDSDVLTDVEVRMTELLAERGVQAGGVITSADVVAIRAQLGEPYEFADGEGDIAVGTVPVRSGDVGRRLYRSTDNAVLGGVLSGIAAYLNINPLWARLAFILLLFISFGTAALVYILFWVLTPVAKTATEKLQMAGKDVTVASIQELNMQEDGAQPNQVAPTIRNILRISLGSLSALASLGVLVGIVATFAAAGFIAGTPMPFTLNGNDLSFAWVIFGLVVLGLLLLAGLFALIAYAFFAKKLTKVMVVSGIAVILLGIASAIGAVSMGTSQSWRITNEIQNMMRTTATTLPQEFSKVQDVTVVVRENVEGGFSGQRPVIQYVVSDGPARYEMKALPNTTLKVAVDGKKATLSLAIPESYRNNYATPSITIYGPALDNWSAGFDATYTTTEKQAALTVTPLDSSSVSVTGSYGTVTVVSGYNTSGATVNLAASAIETLQVNVDAPLYITAGTVRNLNVNYPDVCPSDNQQGRLQLELQGVVSKEMTLNGQKMAAVGHDTNCSYIQIGTANELNLYDEQY